MNDPQYQPSKAELIIHLALGCYEANPQVPDSKERLRKGFDAVIAELRKLSFIPAADIDDFVKQVDAQAPADAMLIPAVLFANSLPDETFYSCLTNSGMFDDMPQPARAKNHHPKFLEAMAKVMELDALHGAEAAQKLPEHKALWRAIFDYAPPEFMELMREGAKEFGLLPETKYANDAGEPVYSAEQIAEKLGIPVERVVEDIIEQMGGLPVVGKIHLVQ